MSDVNAFIEAVGKDVTAVTAPRIDALAAGFHTKAVTDYGPKISAFASQLAKQIIDEQSATVREFATALIQELCERYRPQLVGELRTTIVQNGIQVNGHDIRLDVTRRDTQAVVASLDIPVALTIKVDDIALALQNTTIKLDVVR
jgi:hypothetical protein